MKKEYDLLIIGGGPAGYAAAIRAAQLSFKVALVEQNQLGGTCLNVGCIPSKSFIKSAQVLTTVRNAANYGVKVAQPPEVDFKAVVARGQKIIAELRAGIKSLLLKHKVDLYQDRAILMGPSIFTPVAGAVSITQSGGGNLTLIGKSILLCTGSKVKNLPGLEPDHKVILTSDDLPTLDRVPNSIIIVGGGVVGVEWASILAAFGSKVTILEAADQILPNFDPDVAKELTNSLQKQGIDIITGASLDLPSVRVEKDGESVRGSYQSSGATHDLTAEKILIAIGREPNSVNLGLQNTKVELEPSGHLKVDENFRTKEKHIFAVGDLINFMPLAHAATAAGLYVVELLAGLKPFKLNKHNIPICVYTTPEVAAVGYSEQELEQKGVKYTIGKSSYLSNGKAAVEGERAGFIKVLQDETTHEVLGVHIIGAKATELISVSALARLLETSGLELSKTIFPHPSVAEVFFEAASDIHGAAIHKH